MVATDQQCLNQQIVATFIHLQVSILVMAMCVATCWLCDMTMWHAYTATASHIIISHTSHHKFKICIPTAYITIDSQHVQ